MTKSHILVTIILSLPPSMSWFDAHPISQNHVIYSFNYLLYSKNLFFFSFDAENLFVMFVTAGLFMFDSLCDEILEDHFFHSRRTPEQFEQPSNSCVF